jgi:hypothetical protein
MNYRSLLCTLWCFAFLATSFAPSAQAASSSPRPVKLEDMDYFHARKIILDYGWKPIGGPCEDLVSKSTCAKFPEIDVCSGVGPGYCSMVFVREKRCLYLLTRGGSPQDEAGGDTHVDAVTFRRGRCAKNWNSGDTRVKAQ